MLGRASLAAAGTLYQQGLTFVSGMLIARVVGAADYGIFNLARRLLDVLAILTRLGLEVGLQRRFGEALAESDRAASLAVLRRVRLIANTLSLAAVIAVASGAGRLLEDHVYSYAGFADVLLVLALALPFVTDIAVLGGAYRGALRLAPSILTECVLLPTLRLAIIVALFLLGWRLWAVVVGTTLASFVASAVLAARARSDFGSAPGTGHQPWEDTRRVIGYSSVLAVCVLVSTLLMTMDTLVLGSVASAESLGQYSLVKTLLLLMGVFGMAFSQGLGGLVAERYRRGDVAGLVEVMSLTARWIALCTVPVFAIFLFRGAQLVLLFGESFAISQAVVGWLAVAQFIFSMLGPVGLALSMTGRQGLELVTLVVGLVTAAAGCIAAAPLYGQLGVAIAMSLSMAAAFGLRLWLTKAQLGRIPLSADVVYITAAGLGTAGASELAVRLLPLQGWWSTVAQVGLFIAAYAAVAWLVLLRDTEKSGIATALGATRKYLFCRTG